MRATHALALLITATTTACTGGDDGGAGTDANPGSGSDMPAWSDGPSGHVFTDSGPLYDLDARDGRVLRQAEFGGGTMQAGGGVPYFTAFDTQGTGRVWRLAPGATAPEQIADQSVTLYGVVGNELIGELNEEYVTRTDIATGAITKIPLPPISGGGLACENGSLYQHTLYMTCMAITGTGNSDALLTYDLDANAFGPLVVVGSHDNVADTNVTGTASGALFTRVVAAPGTVMGTRTVFVITGTSVSAGVDLPGTSASNLDEQDAVGTTLFVSQPFGDQVVTFDAATMTAGAPIAMARPRALRAGGGQVWIATHGADGQLAKLDPATGAIAYKSFPRVVSHEIEHIAYSE